MKLHIAEMLRAQREAHVSFHTPGHKRAGADITELSYSDNLYAPHGVLAEAERDVARILGAEKSCLLTDGSTCGVFSMLDCLRAAGKKRVAMSAFSHPSAYHACEVMGLEPVFIAQKTAYGIPVPPTEDALSSALEGADALLLVSPDYYGFFPPLAAAKALCRAVGKPLLIDGAHGAHLHFTERYAGKYADLWVDGVHKSLPALTQGAVVSAAGEWADRLGRAVKRFRTTSPSYPILASVEYAVKYPRNEAIEAASEAFKLRHGCLKNDDWTKILVPFGSLGARACALLEENGIYAEFNDGNYVMFYLSPCTREEELEQLGALLDGLPRGEVAEDAEAGCVPIYKEGA